jgi:hypothetical protein
MIRKTKDKNRWKTGFAIFGAELDDGYFVLWRRFHYRVNQCYIANKITETCRYGMTAEYEAELAAHRLVIKRPSPPLPYTRRKEDNNES